MVDIRFSAVISFTTPVTLDEREGAKSIDAEK